jgi:hypothetical protein
LSLKQLPRWVKLLILRASNFIAVASPKWCENSSQKELLHLQAKVNLARCAYGRRR